MRVWDIPEAQKAAKGTPLVNFLSMSQDERVEAFLTLTSQDFEQKTGSIVFVTEWVTVKKTPLEEFSNIRSSGILAIKLALEDSLIFAGFTHGSDEILITTSLGQSIRFKETDVRPMGRVSGGVTGIKLGKKGDRVVGTVIISKETGEVDLLTVSEYGYGKKTPTEEYKIQNRAGSGILTYKVTDKTGKLVSARSLSRKINSDILIATSYGMVLRLSSKQIPSLGRATQGVRLMKTDEKDKVISMAVLEEELEEIEE